MDKQELLVSLDRLPKFKEEAVWVGQAPVRQRHLKAIVREGSSEAIAIVHRSYRLLQFKEVFEPIVQRLEDIDGMAFAYKGKAMMYIFPRDSNVGILVQNSVDRSYALKVTFIFRDGTIGFLPREVLGFRHPHRGKVLESYQQFTYVLTEVKRAWEAIVDNLTKIKVDEEILTELKSVLKIGKKLNKLLDDFYTPGMSLWDFLKGYLKALSRRQYKSEIHLYQRLQKVSTLIINYALMERARA